MNNLEYPITRLKNGIAVVSLSKSVYDVEAIRQTAYKFSGDYFVVAQENDDTIEVTFESKDNKPISENLVKEICNDFIDQQVRIDTENRFGHIRDLIVEEAFKPVNR